VSEQVTSACIIFKAIAIISGSLVFKAAIETFKSNNYDLLLMGIISYGITGRTLAPPFSSISKTP